MTIAVAIAVPDGIALAADTQTTWQHTITQVVEKGTSRVVTLDQPVQVPIGWSRMARKLFSIKMGADTYAVAVSGAALIHNKTPYSIFKSLEKSYSQNGDFEAVRRFLIDGIKAEFRNQLRIPDLRNAPVVLGLEFILAGHEQSDVSKPVLKTTWVYTGKPAVHAQFGFPGDAISWENQPADRFNVCWTGRGEFLDHVVNHQNQNLPGLTGQYSGLTLADAVDFARFLAEFTCDFQRFAVMVPDCGRPVLSATLTPDGFVEHVGRGA